MIDQAFKSLFRISVLILTLNYSLALIGLAVRPNFKGGVYNDSMKEILFWQGLFLVVYFVMMLFILRAVNIRQIKVPNVKYLNIILWVFLTFILMMVPAVWDFGSYRAFAPNKSTIPEYTVVIVTIILLCQHGKFSRLDKMFLLLFTCFFLLAGYRMVAVYYMIFLLMHYKLKSLMFYGGFVFLLILYTQILRIGMSGFSVQLFFEVITINAFDTLFSSARIVLVNSKCSYEVDYLVSYFFQAFPISSSLNPALYLDNVKECTNIPGGGTFFAYWYYLLGFDAADGINIAQGALALLSFGALLGLVFILYSVSPGMSVVALVFAFRAFNYGPVALFRPSIIFLFLTILLIVGLKILPKKNSVQSRQII